MSAKLPLNSISSRNHVKILGTGSKTILFANGFGCDQNMWRFVTPAFQEDFRIVHFDYVGSGKSDISAYIPERYVTLQGYVKDVLEICEELELRDVIFVGHSVSGMIGLLAAIEQPKYFSKMIMIGPSPCYINDGDYIGGFERKDIEELLEMMDKNYIGWANFLAPNVMANFDRPHLGEELTQSFCSTDPVIAKNFAEATFLSDNREDLKFNTIETLVLQCSEDMIAPLEIGEYLTKTLPHSSVKVMKASGHCPHMSHPDEVIELIKEYLS
ncbi:sigma-B regulation protein RsbQ [Algoriphagus ratkowskyi]|uniref:Alpha/beta hydrolase n=1 Tax=Algoriphagus ratkowskyi TaxID=57028 RepID=A0A2W7RC97_9BACT|nr:alpha/beta hydrolase [Algoriphagus ratkowskyi]PZX55940.1 sigma-B regulation protein RsbQ [Algoriphagus ratkowskyi]TXD77247.1 alpha/beta hydrolase [Algoriphagus ratkowskyi]